MVAAPAEDTRKAKDIEIDLKRIGVELEQLHSILQELRENLASALESDKALQQWQSSTISEEIEGYLTKLRTALNSLLQQASSLNLSKVDKVLWPIKASKLNRDVGVMTRQIKEYLDIIDYDIAFQVATIDRRLVDRRLQTIAQWLTNSEPVNSHDAAHEQNIGKRMVWLFNRPEYISWQNKGGLFWLQGPVGSGKSRISSSVISSLVSKCKNNPRQLILFFYFKEAQKHGPSDMLRSITAQMCQNTCEKPEEAIRVLEKFYELGQLPSNEELLKIISTLTQKLDRVYVIIDGVGECVSRSALFKVVSKLLDKNDEGNFYVFVSSRDFPDLRHEIVGKHINLVVIRDYKDEAELVFQWAAYRIDQLFEPLARQEVSDILGKKDSFVQHRFSHTGKSAETKVQKPTDILDSGETHKPQPLPQIFAGKSKNHSTSEYTLKSEPGPLLEIFVGEPKISSISKKAHKTKPLLEISVGEPKDSFSTKENP